jgi:peroxiredoxin
MESIYMINFILLWLMLLLNLLLSISLIRRLNTLQGDRVTGLEAGALAPEIDALTLSGETVSVKNYRGKKVAFFFVSPACTPCREVVSKLHQFDAAAHELGIEITLVSAGDHKETENWVVEMNIKLPILVAPPGRNHFFNDYKIRGTPSFCWIDNNGVVLSAGYLNFEEGIWKELSSASEALKPSALSVSVEGGG